MTDQWRSDVLAPYRELLPKVAPAADPLDDRETWHKLILDFVNHPMNYGSDVRAVGSLARAAGIDPHRAIAKVRPITSMTHRARCNEPRAMADANQTKKLKNPYMDWRNRPYAANAGSEERRKQAAAFEAMNEFVRRHGGFVTSPPGKVLRIEIGKGSAIQLTNKLTELGYRVMACGTVTRVTGAQALSHKAERLTGTPSAFAEMDVLEIRLDGR